MLSPQTHPHRGPTIRRALLAALVAGAGALVLPASPAAAVNTAPSTPQLLSPVPFGGVNGGPGQLFTVRSTDPEGDPYYATIKVSGGTTMREFQTLVAASGSEATATAPLPVQPGVYYWQARATDVPTDRTTNIQNSAWSTTQTFVVNSPATIGAGAVTGDVSFSGSGLPGATQPCGATSFRFTSRIDPTLPDADSGIVVNLQGHEYAGPFRMSGNGSDTCANASAASGTLSVSAQDTEPSPGSLACALGGYYTRLLFDVTLSLAGTCTVNGVTTAPVNFRAEVELRPDRGVGPGQVTGVDQAVAHAVFVGKFTVLPS